MSMTTGFGYDALDRLTTIRPPAGDAIQRHYIGDHLSTECRGAISFSILRNTAYVLAQHSVESNRQWTTLLVTDIKCSVLNELSEGGHTSFVYMPFGFRRPINEMNSLLAFNGERLTTPTGHYLLGNGRRAFNPELMRFNSPDKLSPWGRGGMNAYAYCKGDPVNFIDPTGQFLQVLLNVLKLSRRVLKVGWKGYAQFLRPRQGGVAGTATMLSRAGYATTAVGWGLERGGYAVGTHGVIVGKWPNRCRWNREIGA